MDHHMDHHQVLSFVTFPRPEFVSPPTFGCPPQVTRYGNLRAQDKLELKTSGRQCRGAGRFGRFSRVHFMLAFLLRAGHGSAWLAAVYVPLIVFGFAWAGWLITGGIRDLIRLRNRPHKPRSPLSSASVMATLSNPTPGILER